MLHQCGHQSASAYPCSCGFLCSAGGCGGAGGGASATLSFLFPVSGKPSMDEVFDGANVNAFSSSSSSSPLVDCTLSLGTPSTRQTEEKVRSSQGQRPSCMSNFCWDILSGNKKGASMNGSNGGSSGAGSSLGDDPLLLARRCANCDTTSTPLWRNGPRGPKSLCNACGIRYKKEERRAAASTISMSSSSAAAEQGIGYGYHRAQPSPWGCYSSSSMRSSASISMYEDMADDGGDATFLSWRLNVVPPTQFPVRDRPSLYQYN